MKQISIESSALNNNALNNSNFNNKLFNNAIIFLEDISTFVDLLFKEKKRRSTVSCLKSVGPLSKPNNFQLSLPWPFPQMHKGTRNTNICV